LREAGVFKNKTILSNFDYVCRLFGGAMALLPFCSRYFLSWFEGFEFCAAPAVGAVSNHGFISTFL
jgi:hypothetical protein